jgi:hypothetical protein
MEVPKNEIFCRFCGNALTPAAKYKQELSREVELDKAVKEKIPLLRKELSKEKENRCNECDELKKILHEVNEHLLEVRKTDKRNNQIEQKSKDLNKKTINEGFSYQQWVEMFTN